MHFVLWKKPGSINYLLYNLIHMSFWKRENYRDGKEICSCQWLVYKEGLDNSVEGAFLYGSRAVDTSSYSFIKTHKTAQRVNFNVWKPEKLNQNFGESQDRKKAVTNDLNLLCVYGIVPLMKVELKKNWFK